MKHFNKILCPYDFSEYADEALKYAIKLADPDTLILLLNIIQLPYLIDPNGFTYYDHKAEALQLYADLNMNKKLADLKMSYPNYKFEYSIDIDNDPAVVILKTQKEKQIDLVVMGSHGRKGLDRLLMGSVAESVLREATCPVLIIKNK